MCAHRPPTGVPQCTGTTSWIPIHSRRRRAGAVCALPRRVPVGHLLALAHGRFRSAARRLRRRLVHANQGSGACVRPPPSTRPAPAQHPPSTRPAPAQHRRPAQQHPVLPRESRAARAPGCTGCRREAKHNVPRARAAGTRLSRMAARLSAAATTSTRRPTHYGYAYYARRA